MRQEHKKCLSEEKMGTGIREEKSLKLQAARQKARLPRRPEGLLLRNSSKMGHYEPNLVRRGNLRFRMK
jgi:hypothetical protein